MNSKQLSKEQQVSPLLLSDSASYVDITNLRLSLIACNLDRNLTDIDRAATTLATAIAECQNDFDAMNPNSILDVIASLKVSHPGLVLSLLVLTYQAYAYEKKRDYKNAIKSLDEGIKIESKSQSERKSHNLAGAYYQRCEYLCFEKRFVEARMYLRDAIQLDEMGKDIGIVDIDKVVRNCYGDRSQSDKNEEKISQTKKTAFDLYQGKDFNKAELLFSQLIALNPLNSTLYLYRARCRIQLVKLKKSSSKQDENEIMADINLAIWLVNAMLDTEKLYQETGEHYLERSRYVLHKIILNPIDHADLLEQCYIDYEKGLSCTTQAGISDVLTRMFKAEFAGNFFDVATKFYNLRNIGQALAYAEKSYKVLPSTIVETLIKRFHEELSQSETKEENIPTTPADFYAKAARLFKANDFAAARTCYLTAIKLDERAEYCRGLEKEISRHLAVCEAKISTKINTEITSATNDPERLFKLFELLLTQTTLTSDKRKTNFTSLKLQLDALIQIDPKNYLFYYYRARCNMQIALDDVGMTDPSAWGEIFNDLNVAIWCWSLNATRDTMFQCEGKHFIQRRNSFVFCCLTAPISDNDHELLRSAREDHMMALQCIHPSMHKKLNNDFQLMLCNLAESLFGLEKYDRALEFYRAVRDITPNGEKSSSAEAKIDEIRKILSLSETPEVSVPLLWKPVLRSPEEHKSSEVDNTNALLKSLLAINPGKNFERLKLLAILLSKITPTINNSVDAEKVLGILNEASITFSEFVLPLEVIIKKATALDKLFNSPTGVANKKLLAQAIISLEEGVTLERSICSESYLSNIVNALYLQAIFYFQLNQFESVIKTIESILLYDPTCHFSKKYHEKIAQCLVASEKELNKINHHEPEKLHKHISTLPHQKKFTAETKANLDILIGMSADPRTTLAEHRGDYYLHRAQCRIKIATASKQLLREIDAILFDLSAAIWLHHVSQGSEKAKNDRLIQAYREKRDLFITLRTYQLSDAYLDKAAVIHGDMLAFITDNETKKRHSTEFLNQILDLAEDLAVKQSKFDLADVYIESAEDFVETYQHLKDNKRLKSVMEAIQKVKRLLETKQQTEEKETPGSTKKKRHGKKNPTIRPKKSFIRTKKTQKNISPSEESSDSENTDSDTISRSEITPTSGESSSSLESLADVEVSSEENFEQDRRDRIQAPQGLRLPSAQELQERKAKNKERSSKKQQKLKQRNLNRKTSSIEPESEQDTDRDKNSRGKPITTHDSEIKIVTQVSNNFFKNAPVDKKSPEYQAKLQNRIRNGIVKKIPPIEPDEIELKVLNALRDFSGKAIPSIVGGARARMRARVLANVPSKKSTYKGDYDFRTAALPDEITKAVLKIGGTIKANNSKKVYDPLLVRAVIDGKDVDIRYSEHLAKDLPDYEQDALSCDTTTGALSFGLDKRLRDPSRRGWADLQNKIIDTIEEPVTSFTEDPVRILRVIKQAVSEDFSLAQRLEDAIKSTTPDLVFLLLSKPDQTNIWLGKLFYHENHNEAIGYLFQLNILRRLFGDLIADVDDETLKKDLCNQIAATKKESHSLSTVYDILLHHCKEDKRAVILNKHPLLAAQYAYTQKQKMVNDFPKYTKTPADANRWLESILLKGNAVTNMRFLFETSLFSKLFPTINRAVLGDKRWLYQSMVSMDDYKGRRMLDIVYLRFLAKAIFMGDLRKLGDILKAEPIIANYFKSVPLAILTHNVNSHVTILDEAAARAAQLNAAPKQTQMQRPLQYTHLPSQQFLQPQHPGNNQFIISAPCSQLPLLVPLQQFQQASEEHKQPSPHVQFGFFNLPAAPPRDFLQPSQVQDTSSSMSSSTQPIVPQPISTVDGVSPAVIKII
ncbi:MAG: hypothetical protein ABI597_04015 [Gammaproteobacteria bacterium]